MSPIRARKRSILQYWQGITTPYKTSDAFPRPISPISLFLARPAEKAWKIWMSKLEEIEKNFEKPGLAVTPPYKAREALGKSGKLPWIVGCWLLPLLLFILWLTSLIVAIR